MLERERAPLDALGVEDPKGRWRARIEARVPPRVEAQEGAAVLRADVGTEGEVRCWIYDEQLDPSVTLSSVLASTRASVEFEHVGVYHVGVVRDIPVLAISALYTTKSTPPLAGELKIALSPRVQHSLVCVQDEPGYRDAFVRTFETLSTSLESDAELREPQLSSVWEVKSGEALTGYAWDRIYAEEDGTLTAFRFGVLLAQLTSGLRLRSDIQVSVHDRSGIVRANYLAYVGAKEAHELELSRGEAGAYTYRGEVAGKPVEGKVESGGALSGYYELLVELQRRAGSDGATSFGKREYHPAKKLEAAIEVTYALDAAREKLSSDGSSWSLARGLPVSAETRDGPLRVTRRALSQRSSLGAEPGVVLGAKPLDETRGPLPLGERRRAFQTQILAEAERNKPKPPPKQLSLVRYRAPLGENAAYVSPVRRGAKRAAIIWVGDSPHLGITESPWTPAPHEKDASARALREAGLVLMLPSLRGSHDNPGKIECFLGEVDDLVAAADHLALREDVDPERIYLGGHGRGATLALLAAASTERFRAVFAFGPAADARQYGTPEEGGCLPEDAAEAEVALRSPLEHVSTIRTPTYVFEGAEHGNTRALEALRERASERVHFSVVPGVDSSGILAPGTEAVARAIAAGSVDDAHLVFTP